MRIRAVFFSILLGALYAQSVGIGTATPDASARLEVSSSNQGVLIPRVNLSSVTDATTIPNPATSLLIYNTNTNLPQGAGYYYNAGTSTAPRWLSINNEVVWYHLSATGGFTTNSNTFTLIPGLSQTITVPSGYHAEVEIWAQAGVSLEDNHDDQSWAVGDIAVFRNGNWLTYGGYNRVKINQSLGSGSPPSGMATAVPVFIVARDVITTPGSYTYELMGRRRMGNIDIYIGGDCFAVVNCGELKLAVRYRPQ